MAFNSLADVFNASHKDHIDAIDSVGNWGSGSSSNSNLDSATRKRRFVSLNSC